MEQQESIFNKIEDFLKSNSRALIHVNFELQNQLQLNINFKYIFLIISEQINGNQDIKQISSKLAECTEIKTLNLDIACWHLKDDQIKLLFGELPGLKNMDAFKLNLSYNRISNLGISIIGAFFKKCTNLKQLLIDFYGNKIDSKLSSELIEVVNQVKSIQQLELLFGGNKIEDIGLLSIANGLSNCACLELLQLSIYDNYISDEGYLKLDQYLQMLPSLLNLEYSFSQSEKLLKSREILNCKNIKVLTLNVYECKSKRQKFEHKIKALKIKRLVKLKINDF
ncbi:hypothetical protein ABPG72_021186 [Tetrahymena utriculariae]